MKDWVFFFMHILCIHLSNKEINLANLSESLYCLCDNWPGTSITCFIMKLKAKVGTSQGKSFLYRFTKSHWMVHLAGLNIQFQFISFKCHLRFTTHLLYFLSFVWDQFIIHFWHFYLFPPYTHTHTQINGNIVVLPYVSFKSIY